ncbi:peptide-methionine (S)-S-oxide reductase MsrA [Crocosphaera sp. XPORK-15E]|uniref:peptide-methionine (S)-S-oxide reductase MsrA n=1 Tax=Crocosphaera sp. XPORK-15E TaxID=3110247 RepID=UPI002B1EAFC6|nr:peptide-methionine (S)-S-oxide reductase MsrA [Crocosphaera sp. XPORK-15E]MEA5532769.1 peptide-methionine (S)-S-oxide reductase MsrA [Crocosphaera sp. XPORK-15E]
MSETIVLGGGCFWCVESVFQAVEGVEAVESGYAGGQIKNPTYEAVCGGKTGHAEVVKVTFDPQKISLTEILEIFFVASHDPTTLNRQGNDVGTQYRSIILWESQQQLDTAKIVIERLNDDETFNGKIVTELEQLSDYYPAEEYHQNYFRKHPNQPYCAFSIPPKLAKLKKYFPDKALA